LPTLLRSLLYVGQTPLGDFSSLLGTTLSDPGVGFSGVDATINNATSNVIAPDDTFTYDAGAGPTTQNVENSAQFFQVRTFDEFGAQIGSATLIGTQMDNGDVFFGIFFGDGFDSPVSSITFDTIGGNSATVFLGDGSNIDGANVNPPPPCFVSGTLICSARGLVPVQEIRQGDLIQTIDNGMRSVRWIGKRCVLGSELHANPKFRPIRIKANALGNGQPYSDLLVSPQHRVLIRSKIAQRMFGAEEVLLPAIKLTDHDGIELVNDLTEVTYFHFMFDTHEIVFSNGAATESFYPGKQALRSVGEASRNEIFQLFPELMSLGNRMHPARPFALPGRARKLVHRHKRNRRELIEDEVTSPLH